MTTTMSETVSQEPKRGRHSHHLLKIPVANVTNHENVVESSARSLAYKIMYFVQSTPVIMATAIVLVAASLLPCDVSEVSNANNDDEKVKPRTLVYFVYMASFSMHFGSQFWMTIVSGLSLYFNLPRHAFADVQKILFPKYFSINSVLSAITLIQFRKMSVDAWELHTFLQLIALNVSFLLELTIWLFFVPTVLNIITAKTAIEKEAGLGKEVGRCNLGRLVDCPDYMTKHRIFCKMHKYMAIGNIVTIMCSIYHLAYISA